LDRRRGEEKGRNSNGKHSPLYLQPRTLANTFTATRKKLALTYHEPISHSLSISPIDLKEECMLSYFLLASLDCHLEKYLSQKTCLFDYQLCHEIGYHKSRHEGSKYETP
jgi:hypothetical protein